KTFIELPSQFTKLSVTINDSSVDFNPKNIPGRIILVLDSLKVLMLTIRMPSLKRH
ncbi:12838_t:CDS:1, partial [Funneliformis caledonium]